jgi:ribosomal protein L37E
MHMNMQHLHNLVHLLTYGLSSRLATELARLERNRERRFAREKAKGPTAPSPSDVGAAASPGSPASANPVPGKQQQGTQRKCANCGQVGHIKTNKKCAPGFPSHRFHLVPAPAPRKRKVASSSSSSAPWTPKKRPRTATDVFTAEPDDGWRG